MFEVILSPEAQEFYALIAPLVRKLAHCFAQLEREPRRHNNIKRLTGELAGRWRYRVGNWRVVYRIDGRRGARIDHRSVSRGLRMKPSNVRNSKSGQRTNSSSSRSTSSPDSPCAICARTGIQLRQVTRSYGSGGTLLLIEGIPMFSCPDCGESYFDARTIHEIERIKALSKSLAPKRRAPVAAFHAK